MWPAVDQELERTDRLVAVEARAEAQDRCAATDRDGGREWRVDPDYKVVSGRHDRRNLAPRRLDSRAVDGESFEDPVALMQDLLLRGRPAARDSMTTVRDAAATRPAPELERLRGAYLDLLKLSLCDLAGTTTVSVASMPGGGTASRELRGDERRLRSVGMDWPLQGLTMTGLRRLDDLQACVESVVADGVEGDLIEAGAWRGGASILMRATLDALGDVRTVWVADSFQGFPVDEAGEHIDLSTYDFLSVPIDEVRENFARFGFEDGVRFVPGFFEQTLPSLAGQRWAIARLDGDTYEATMTALDSLYPGLARGGYLIVDDYGALEECRRAVDDFRERHGITEPIEEIDWTGARWRRASDAEVEPASAGAPPAAAPVPEAPQPGARPEHRPVKTVRELRLEKELAALRERLAAAEQAGERRGRLFRR
jgi:O-methyltransferase